MHECLLHVSVDLIRSAWAGEARCGKTKYSKCVAEFLQPEAAESYTFLVSITGFTRWHANA
jgi:hypothetical protein